MNDITWWDVAGGYILILALLTAWSAVSAAIWRRSRRWTYGPRLVLRVTEPVRPGNLLDLADQGGVVFLTLRIIAVRESQGGRYAVARRMWPPFARAFVSAIPVGLLLGVLT